MKVTPDIVWSERGGGGRSFLPLGLGRFHNKTAGCETWVLMEYINYCRQGFRHTCVMLVIPACRIIREIACKKEKKVEKGRKELGKKVVWFRPTLHLRGQSHLLWPVHSFASPWFPQQMHRVSLNVVKAFSVLIIVSIYTIAEVCWMIHSKIN